MPNKELVKKIKEKRELSGLSDSIVEDHLNSKLKKYKLSSNPSKSDEKIIVKEVRAELRRIAGMFSKRDKKKSKLNENNTSALIKSHSSTSERIDFYPELKEIINQLGAKSILDLGCGINPLALATKKIKYFACDINEGELNLIKEFFSKNKINGETFFCNLEKLDTELPKADLCIVLKVLDIVKNREKVASEIFEKVNCKNFLISFSKVKLSGRKMDKPRRIWFERILKSKNLNYNEFSLENEIFYLIESRVD